MHVRPFAQVDWTIVSHLRRKGSGPQKGGGVRLPQSLQSFGGFFGVGVDP